MEFEEVIAQYSYLWDGTEDWVLSKQMHQATRLKIKCSSVMPTANRTKIKDPVWEGPL